MARQNSRTRWKKEWKEFAAQPPGRRFRDRFEQRRDRRSPGASGWRKALNLAGGVALLLIGVFFVVAPGPAVVFFVVGGLLVANESYWAARVFDGIDVMIAPLLRWLQRRWRALSPTAQRAMKGCMIAGMVVGLGVSIAILR